jgi:fido (protein-threonine AMPylation protein)
MFPRQHLVELDQSDPSDVKNLTKIGVCWSSFRERGRPVVQRAWDEVVFSGDADPAVLSRAVKRGTLRRIARGVYTGLVDADPADVVLHRWSKIVGHELPGAVIVDRSARAAGPVGGALFVDHPRTRSLELPGLTVVPRHGPGPVPGDMEMPDGLWIASIARQLLDNLDRSRGAERRTLTDTAVEEWVDTLLVQRGEDDVNRLRDQARNLAPVLGRDREFDRLEKIIRAALTTGDISVLRSERLRARAAGQPYDERRVAAFETLAADLAARAPDAMPALPADKSRRRLLPFYEAYFSNYIEGTEFTLDEAASIVFDAVVPADRPADAHDILGTYEVVSDPNEMARIPRSPNEYEELLRSRHARLMSDRLEQRPGQYKERPNRAGSTEFVAPRLVPGTLRRGFESGDALTSPFARAVYIMFLTSEVHPFADGNGRVARMMMNAELVAGGEVRIVVPTVYRNNYLAALRGATHTGHYAALYAMLAFARRYTAQIDFSSRERAESELAATNALRDSTEAESAGVRLILPMSLAAGSTGSNGP